MSTKTESIATSGASSDSAATQVATTTTKPRRRRTAPGQGRSAAAKRAYQRRQRREAILGGDKAPRLVRRRSGQIAARAPFVISVLAILSLGLVVTLLLSTRAAEDSYLLSSAKRENVRLSEQRDALAREVKLNDSSPELAAAARRLGMIPAKDPARLVVAQDGSVQVVGKVAPAAGNAAAPLNRTASPALLGSPAALKQQSTSDRMTQLSPRRSVPRQQQSVPTARQSPVAPAAPQSPAAVNTPPANPVSTRVGAGQSTPMTVQQLPGGPR